jgi:cleavage and polyadenylation specificity factor subunit 3
MFLEEQFGSGISPIEKPRAVSGVIKAPTQPDEVKSEEDDDDDIEELEAEERARLAALGIPVPGLEIKVDKHVAKIWLENLEIECANGVLRDRVRAVVERAVETIAPLWTVQGMARR